MDGMGMGWGGVVGVRVEGAGVAVLAGVGCGVDGDEGGVGADAGVEGVGGGVVGEAAGVVFTGGEGAGGGFGEGGRRGHGWRSVGFSGVAWVVAERFGAGVSS